MNMSQHVLLSFELVYMVLVSYLVITSQVLLQSGPCSIEDDSCVWDFLKSEYISVTVYISIT